MRTLAPAVVLLASLGALAAAGWGGGASAQVVQGRFVDSERRSEGIGGAMMVLLDEGDREVARGLTRASGLFRLLAPSAGRFRVRAERIGYATTLSESIEVSAADTAVIEIAARIEAVSLAGIETQADRRCRVRPEEGLAVTRVWDEARKALEAAAWTQERGLYNYEMQNIRRRMDRDNRRLVSEERVYDRGVRKTPYVSRPAEELVEEGFAHLSPVESIYYAPDAAVLLSDPFLDTHCFRLRSDENRAPGLVGLAFEPLGRRRVPDISGTLWIDPATSQLEWLDFNYQYLDLPASLLSAPLGGRVEFEALPNGTWIVDSWRIRMPVARNVANPLNGTVQTILDGLSVQGGDVIRVHSDEDGTVLEADAGGRIAGFVFDSLRVGLPDARVYVAGTGIGTPTNRDGRFELVGLEPGAYSVTFSHPYLDRFAYVPMPFEVEIEPGAEAPSQINFIAPTMARLMSRVCADEERPEDAASMAGAEVLVSTGILIGQVTDSLGAGMPDMIVRVLARDFDIQSQATSVLNRTLRAGRSGVAVTTDERGYYRACWVPVESRLRVALLRPGDEIDSTGLEVGYTITEAARLYERSVLIPAERPVRILDLQWSGHEPGSNSSPRMQ